MILLAFQLRYSRLPSPISGPNLVHYVLIYPPNRRIFLSSLHQLCTMAVPADITTLNLTGKYQLNKTLSDDPDAIFKEQGVGWIMRKAIGIASVYLDIKHYKDDNGVEHIEVISTVTGGIPGEEDHRILHWEQTEYKSRVYGSVTCKSKRIKVEEVEIEHLAKGWTEDTVEHGVIYVHTESDTPKSKNTWTFDQTFGVEEVNGERKYSMHIHFNASTSSPLERRYVYDYCGPL
ncbi:hypothetical protein JOM56_010971 [Amanita muscaria]